MDESRLITGPPASGKSRAALDRFLATPGSTLVTPTATMAEHIRHELARRGQFIRPDRVVTLARFLEALTPLAEAPEAVLHLLIEQALDHLRPARFAAVARFSGFHGALAALIEEVPRDRLGGTYGDDLARVFDEVENSLRARGLALRNGRLRSAGTDGGGPVILDGFFSFSPAELAWIEAIAARRPVTVTLPDWPGADWPGASAARDRLLASGFVEQRCEQVLRAPVRDAFSAPSLEQETEEIARRILELAARGRAFREIAIVLRVRDPYGPAIETALARFGIPARMHFADPVASHPAIQYLAGMVRAMLDGWEHESILKLLNMPVSGVGATPDGDRFAITLAALLPGKGLPVEAIADPPAVLESFGGIDGWCRDKLAPIEWAARLKTLGKFIPRPRIEDGPGREQVLAWRSTAAALEAFGIVLDQAATALEGQGKIALNQFWGHADTALTLHLLRVPDRRRNVVNVFDVYEARQWEVPVVFVCGLVERHFPQYHREDPLLNDAARRRAGLRTSADRQAEERFLFELATSRATEQTVLSYARFNEKGEEMLPSFFLQGSVAPMPAGRSAPRSSRSCHESPKPIEDDSQLARLQEIHKTLAATSIESFLQCPFQFFAAKTLRLRERPPAPRDRLDVRVQGNLLHKTLAELSRAPLLGAAVFDRVFEDECRRLRIPATYRTEAVRLELLRHFETFLADRQIPLSWPSRVEEKFRFALNPLLAITGRIDRLDIGSRKEALVIDYKYSAGLKVRERIEETAAGNLVQGGLYLLAAERQFGLVPAGMLYCGLRDAVVWDGWHVPVPGLETIGESRTPAALRELIDTAVQKATDTFEAITSGRVAPQPADPAKCRWCDFRYICRIESGVETTGVETKDATRRAGAE